jgi:hypothetical protein
MLATSLMVLSAAFGGAPADARPAQLPGQAQPGRYVGAMYPGANFRLRVTSGGRVKFRGQPQLRCSDKFLRTFTFNANHPPKLDFDDGSFSYREKGRIKGGARGRYRFRITGNVGRVYARGQFSAVVTRKTYTCRIRSKDSKWDARRQR